MPGAQLHHFGALGSFQGDEFDELDQPDAPADAPTDAAADDADAVSGGVGAGVQGNFDAITSVAPRPESAPTGRCTIRQPSLRRTS